jgi:hypothetical protein
VRRTKQQLRAAILSDMVEHGMEQILDDGRIVRLTTRTAPRRVDPERMRHLVVTARPPAQHRAVAPAPEEFEDMEVSESGNGNQPSSADRLSMWVESVVADELLPKRTMFEIITPKRRRSTPTMPAHEIQRHVLRLEAANDSIRGMSNPERAQQAKSLGETAANLEPDVMEVLTRLGGCARYRIVHEGEEMYASLYVCERRRKAPPLRARELHDMVSAAVSAAVEGQPAQTFEALLDAWEKDALGTVVGDALAAAMAERNERGEWVKRSVALRRNGTGENE